MDERCVVGAQYEGDKKLLHSDFIDYCWQKKIKRLELNALGRELSKYSVRDRQVGSGKQHVWSGIALKGGESGKEDDIIYLWDSRDIFKFYKNLQEYSSIFHVP
jgi:hypothetical protein